MKKLYFFLPFFIPVLILVSYINVTAQSNSEEIKIKKGQLINVPPIKRSDYRDYEYVNQSENLSGSRLGSEQKTDSLIYFEDFETNPPSWFFNGDWDYGVPNSGPGAAFSPLNCMATNLDGSHLNNSNSWTISPEITLPQLNSNEEEILLTFYEWFQIESGYDYGHVAITIDDGQNWITLDSRDGTSDWRKYEIDITSYAGSTIKVGFQFTSDNSVVNPGWYIDDIRVGILKPMNLGINIVNINSNNFPFIYLNANATSPIYDVLSFDKNNFEITEDNVSQTDYYEVTQPTQSGGTRLADIVFLMDNSGSMSGEQNAVRNNVIDFVNNLSAAGVDFSLGLCRFGASENSGNPIIEDNGNLTSDVDYFKNTVWLRNTIDGGHEPGWDALFQTASAFNFRVGAQKIFILITDESVTGNGNMGTYDKQTTIDILNANSVNMFALIDSLDTYSVQDYGFIAEETSGNYFNIYSNFDVILASIIGYVSNNFLIRYRTTNDQIDGVERTVTVQLSHLNNQVSDNITYVAGNEPKISRTDNSLSIHGKSWAEGSNILIEVDVFDYADPPVQNVTLFYRNTGTTSYFSISMTFDSNTGTWSAVIPITSVLNPGVDYYIVATDGITTSTDPFTDPSLSPYQFAVLPNEAPMIIHQEVTQHPDNTDIEITAEISDETNSLVKTRLYYRQVGQLIYLFKDMINTSGSTYTSSIPDSFTNMNGIEYYISAVDDFGLEATIGTASKPIGVEIVLEQIEGIFVDRIEIEIDANPSFSSWNNYGTNSSRGNCLGIFKFYITDPNIVTNNFTNVKLIATLAGDNQIVTLKESTDNNPLDTKIDLINSTSEDNFGFIIEIPNNLLRDFENELLEIKLVEVNGNQYDLILFADFINFYYAKKPDDGNRLFYLDYDAYSYQNPKYMSAGEYRKELTLLLSTTSFFSLNILNIPSTLTYSKALKDWSDGGRCFGMASSTGAFFMNNDLKIPMLGDKVFDWPENNVVMDHLIFHYQESQRLKTYSTSNPTENYTRIKESIRRGNPVIFGFKSFAGGHAVLAHNLTEFNNSGINMVHVYDNNNQYTNKSFKYITLNKGNLSFEYSSNEFTNNNYYEFFSMDDFSLTDPFLIGNLIVNNIRDFLNIDNSKIFSTACPVNLIVQNENGQRFGFDQNGLFVNEIIGASVDRYAANEIGTDSLTILTVPKEGNYTSTIYGYDNGYMLFEYYEPVDEDQFNSVLVDSVKISSTTVIKFDDSAPKFLLIDKGNDGIFEDKLYTMYNSYPNHKPILNDQVISIIEGKHSGESIIQLQVTDANELDTHKFSILEGDNNIFSLDSITGNIYVKDTIIDYETQSFYELKIKVEDNNIMPMADEAYITVNVIDINEPPLIEDQLFSVEEEQSELSIGHIQAFDQDIGQKLSYSIIGSDKFNIDTSTGELFVNSDTYFNYEKDSLYTFTIRVKDNGQSVLESDGEITIKVIDINEKPIFNTRKFNIDLNVDTLSHVGYLEASDPDFNQKLNYRFLEGNEQNIFDLDRVSGKITLVDLNKLINSRLDSLSIIAEVEDDGIPPLSNTSEVIIKMFQLTSYLNVKMNDNSIIVYPNPVQSYLTIKGKFKNGMVRVLDQSGKVVYLQKIPYTMKDFKLDVSKFPSGIYIIQIINEQERSNIQFIKN